MKFRIGDKVKFLNDTSKGIVTGFADEKTVIVKIEEGFDVPVLMNEIIPTGDSVEYSDSFSEESNEQIADHSEPENTSEINNENLVKEDQQEDQIINLAIVKKVGQGENDKPVFQMYLINDGTYNIRYNLGKQKGDLINVISDDTLEANTKILIYEGGISEFTAIGKTLRFHCLFVKEDIFRYLDPFTAIIDLSSIDLQKKKLYSENDYFNEQAILISIYSGLLSKSKSRKEEMKEIYTISEPENKDKNITRSVPKMKNSGIEEVDLHIEEILDDHRGMSNSEILKVQLDRFTTALESAVKTQQKKIVFIHGLGNGKLKYEVRKLLDTKYNHLKYQDASFKEYGYGATLVYLK